MDTRHQQLVVSLREWLDAAPDPAMVFLCFATRKRNEAWNPGSFGCRGLLVHGLCKI